LYLHGQKSQRKKESPNEIAPVHGARLRVSGGCIFVAKAWIPEPVVRETTQIGMLPAPVRETTSLAQSR
jgi:hypothetical protein